MHNAFPQIQRCELERVRLCLQGTAVLACRLPNTSPTWHLGDMTAFEPQVTIYVQPSWSPTWRLGDMTSFEPQVTICTQPSWGHLQPLPASFHGTDESPHLRSLSRILPPSHLNAWKILGLSGGFQMAPHRRDTAGRERHPHCPAR